MSQSKFKIGERVVYWPSNDDLCIGNIKHFSKEFRYFKVIKISELNDTVYYLIEDDNGEDFLEQVWTTDIISAEKVKSFFKIEEEIKKTNFKDEKIYFK